VLNAVLKEQLHEKQIRKRKELFTGISPVCTRGKFRIFSFLYFFTVVLPQKSRTQINFGAKSSSRLKPAKS
jgi:hypothetical protein